MSPSVCNSVCCYLEFGWSAVPRPVVCLDRLLLVCWVDVGSSSISGLMSSDVV